MRSIHVFMHDDSGQEARFQAALDVARALDGHLTCIGVAIMPATAFDRGLDTERQIETVNRGKVEARLQNEGVPWSWVEIEDYAEEAVTAASSLADLIIVNTEGDGISEGVVRTIGRRLVGRQAKPVLAVPAESRGIDVGGNALIAWDGSKPADCAVMAAVPLLKLAKSVTLLQFDDDEEHPLPEKLASYLSGHGIHPEILLETVKPNRVDDALLQHATRGQFSMVVMGAFSRSKLVEMLFGGVTRRMLKDSPVPLFLAH